MLFFCELRWPYLWCRGKEVIIYLLKWKLVWNEGVSTSSSNNAHVHTQFENSFLEAGFLNIKVCGLTSIFHKDILRKKKKKSHGNSMSIFSKLNIFQINDLQFNKESQLPSGRKSWGLPNNEVSIKEVLISVSWWYFTIRVWNY